MRKMFLIIVCILVISCLGQPCMATSLSPEDEVIIHQSYETLENGITVTSVISTSATEARGVSKAYTKKTTFTREGITIAEIWIDATFRYDTQTVSVVSKSISKCETYDGWSFKQSSFTSSGGTVTLTGKLTKLLVLNANINISLTCDENGNIS